MSLPALRVSLIFSALISTSEQLTAFLPHLDGADRVALDTEADSLHVYREKLCLVQVSLPQ